MDKREQKGRSTKWKGRGLRCKSSDHQPRCRVRERTLPEQQELPAAQWERHAGGPRCSMACEQVIAVGSTGDSRRGDARKEVGEEEEVRGPCVQAGWVGPFPASLLGALRGGAVEGRSTWQQEPGGASSVDALA